MSDNLPPASASPELSRRAFLRGSSLTAAASALANSPAQLWAATAQPGAPTVPGMGPAGVSCSFQVNGKPFSATVEPRVTLLDALRNYLDVTSAKRVCDRGTCGACTVLLDGKPIYSCMTLALEAQGRKIETAAALVSEAGLHAVPAAFAKHDAQQCGFCTPGFVVAMKAAFDKNPNASPQEVEAALAGNICRCGTYQQMRDAIRSLCEKKT